MTRSEMKAIGYEYVGPMGDGNELWRWRDELVLYNPDTEEITWREYQKPTQTTYYLNGQKWREL